MFGKLLLVLCALSGFALMVDTARKNGTDVNNVLSRRRRYLVFPEGSSLQLVYCLTMPLIGQRTVFTVGATAALAWELPSEPMQLKKPIKSKTAEKRIDKPGKFGGWTTYDNSAPSPYKYQKQNNRIKPLLYNYYNIPTKYKTIPTLQTSYSTITNSPAYKQAILRKNWYNSNVNYNKMYYRKNASSGPVTMYMNPVYHDVHRRSRRDLYGKIEKFFAAQSKDGRACLLKSVCEVSQAPQDKGSFMEEIIKAIFKVKPHEQHPDEDEYDMAAKKSHDCAKMYAACDGSIWNMI